MWNNIKELLDGDITPELKRSILNLLRYNADNTKQKELDALLDKSFNAMFEPGISHKKHKQEALFQENMSPKLDKLYSRMTKYLHSPTFKKDADAYHKYFYDAYEKENPDWWRENVDISFNKMRQLLQNAEGIDLPEDYQYDEEPRQEDHFGEEQMADLKKELGTEGNVTNEKPKEDNHFGGEQMADLLAALKDDPHDNRWED